jgi:hypothetical protein
MRPFQQFRLWVRRAPILERCVAALAATVVVAGLLSLAAAGSDDDGAGSGFATDVGSSGVAAEDDDTTSGEQSGGPTADQSVSGIAAGPPSSSGASSGAGTAVGASGASGDCVSPPGSDQGVTDKEIKIAIFIVELAGAAGNETLNVPAPAEQRGAYDAMVDELNKTGGVACRKVTPLYFTVNPLDQNDLQATCLDVVEADVFYVNDIGAYSAYPAFVDCFIRNKIPFFESAFIPQAQVEKSYPYLFGTSTHDNLYFNTAFALKERGFFDPAEGFKKLGIFYQDCIKEHPQKYLGWLEQATGIERSQISQYNFGCPTAVYASPSDVAAAVLQFQRAGVTHVTHVRGDGDWYNFTRTAQQQGYKPTYGFGDVSASYSAYGTLSPNWQNADGTTLITLRRFGEERTPGLTPTPTTQRCQRIMAAHGQPDMYKQKLGMGGLACNNLWMFALAVNNAPELKRERLAEGLYRGRSLDLSFPHGPAAFPTPRTTTGVTTWRPLVAHADCSCWRVDTADFRPTFPGFR